MKLKNQNESDRVMLLETGREEERQIIYHDALASSHENFQSIQSKKEMKK